MTAEYTHRGLKRYADVRTPAELLQEFQEYPDRFWDNRENKLNPRHPDYKHKDSGDGIWLQTPPAASATAQGFAAPPSGAPPPPPEGSMHGGAIQPTGSAPAGDYGSDYDAASSVSTGGFSGPGQAAPQAARAMPPAA